MSEEVDGAQPLPTIINWLHNTAVIVWDECLQQQQQHKVWPDEGGREEKESHLD